MERAESLLFNVKLIKMKKMNLDQMEQIQGGVCGVARGIAGLGAVGLMLGLTTGGLGMAVICACAAYSSFC